MKYRVKILSAVLAEVPFFVAFRYLQTGMSDLRVNEVSSKALPGFVTLYLNFAEGNKSFPCMKTVS